MFRMLSHHLDVLLFVIYGFFYRIELKNRDIVLYYVILKTSFINSDNFNAI